MKGLLTKVCARHKETTREQDTRLLPLNLKDAAQEAGTGTQTRTLYEEGHLEKSCNL